MKVLFDCPVPFSLAHGGQQIQIEQTSEALKQLGVVVEPLRWWDPLQSADILHYFGRTPLHLLQAARQKGMKIVTADLLTGQGSRPPWRHALQRAVFGLSNTFMPANVRNAIGWLSYREANACVALTDWEARLLRNLYGVPANKVHVVPNGVEDAFLKSGPAQRGSWLVCTATITERKRVLELGQAAVRARTPLWIIGKPYAETDAYAQRFTKLAKTEATLIRYEGPIEDRFRLAEIYRQARGFVLLSSRESLSLSALEAAACECPLLLSDLPWARTVFSDRAVYCNLKLSTEKTALVLRQFYDRAPQLPLAPRPLSWIEVAEQLKQLYVSLLSTSS